MSDKHAKGVIFAVDKRFAANFGLLAMAGEEVPPTFGFSIERIATQYQRDDNEHGEIRETKKSNDRPRSSSHPVFYRPGLIL